jgi:hypothetical protein
VLDALKYLRCALFAIQKPRLRQDTGIFVSDGAIPDSLHREVSELVSNILFFQLNHLTACDRTGCTIQRPSQGLPSWYVRQGNASAIGIFSLIWKAQPASRRCRI